ncbi:MAG: preprotein translocase subunit SecG [Alphaproteobacteria bacterium]
MDTVLLTIHLMTAICLVCIILLQRSEGGALSGLGGDSGASSFMNARGKGNFLTKLTTILAIVFFCTSIGLSIYHGQGRVSKSFLETTTEDIKTEAPTAPVAK